MSKEFRSVAGQPVMMMQPVMVHPISVPAITDVQMRDFDFDQDGAIVTAMANQVGTKFLDENGQLYIKEAAFKVGFSPNRGHVLYLEAVSNSLGLRSIGEVNPAAVQVWLHDDRSSEPTLLAFDAEHGFFYNQDTGLDYIDPVSGFPVAPVHNLHRVDLNDPSMAGRVEFQVVHPQILLVQKAPAATVVNVPAAHSSEHFTAAPAAPAAPAADKATAPASTSVASSAQAAVKAAASTATTAPVSTATAVTAAAGAALVTGAAATAAANRSSSIGAEADVDADAAKSADKQDDKDAKANEGWMATVKWALWQPIRAVMLVGWLVALPFIKLAEFFTGTSNDKQDPKSLAPAPEATAETTKAVEATDKSMRGPLVVFKADQATLSSTAVEADNVAKKDFAPTLKMR